MEAEVAITAIQAVAMLCAVWLSSRRNLLDRGLHYLVSLAVGVLLATALLHILPEAVSLVGNRPSLWLVLTSTFVLLFAIERLFVAVTGHPVEVPDGQDLNSGSHHVHHAPRALSLLVGGTLHSFMDGVSVAAAFSTGRRAGWLTAIAITLHEVPHRMGDYALLMHLHVQRRRALWFMVLVALGAIGGVTLVLLAGTTQLTAWWLLPVSTASFVYIALVNLLPELSGKQHLRPVLLQLMALVFGALAVALLLRLPSS